MFRGDVVRPSHEGGLLISFTGSSPALGTTLETENGIKLGKVDTVFGSIHKPWVHVYPITKGLDIVDILGESTIISNKRNSQKDKPRREERSSKFSRNNNRSEKKIFNDNDWICSKCNNDNFSWRERCNKCSAPKGGRDSGRSERPRWGRDSGRSERPRGRDGGRSERPRGKDGGRSERPRGKDGGRSNNSNKKDSKTDNKRVVKRLKGKSKSHFKNRELDNIFKKE